MDLMNIFDLPLTELISERGDMCAAMAKLTGDTLPGNSWEYLTVGELLSLMEGADTVYKCGAVKPLFEGIIEKYDSVAEVFIFGRAPLFEGARKMFAADEELLGNTRCIQLRISKVFKDVSRYF